MPPAARSLARLAVGWTALGYAVPYYPLYALFFLATGLTEGQVSALFALWSVTGFLAEVPAGALADRWSRRGCLVLASVLEAAGFAVWTAWPGFPSFAAGFLLWGLGGALQSGAAEALVYEGLAAAGADGAYPRVNGWISATELAAGLPTAGAAAGLYALGGFGLVGWVSVGVCLVAAGLATRFPEAHRPVAEWEGGTFRGTFRAVALRQVGSVVLAVALVGGVDAIEEYFPVLAADWGVPTPAVPLAVLVVPLTGAVGAALGGRAARLRGRGLATLLGLAAVLLAVAAWVGRPIALVPLALFYGAYCAVLVVAEARLQDRITGPYRATVTSVASLGIELTSLAVFGAWALHGALAVAVLVAAVVPVLGLALRRPRGVGG